MKEHWAMKYTTEKWSDKQDCFYWFRLWTKELTGRNILDPHVQHNELVRNSIKVMTSNIHDIFNYKQTDSPVEGDAVFLSQRTLPHHIGMVITPHGQFRVLHALENCGILISSITELSLNGWKIKGYWTYDET